MDNLSQFKPIVPEQKAEMMDYYKQNNIPVPDNTYFRDYFEIKPQEIEAVTPITEETPKKKAWDFDNVEVAEIAKYTKMPEKFKTSTGDKKNEFFNKFWVAADKASKKIGIPAETLLAISALETGYGKSMPGNMVAGIKADKGYSGPIQELDTTEVIDGKSVKVKAKFRSYENLEKAFEDFGNFFKKNPRYMAALNQTDPYKAAQEIAKAGYATDPNYYSKIKNILDYIIT